MDGNFIRIPGLLPAGAGSYLWARIAIIGSLSLLLLLLLQSSSPERTQDFLHRIASAGSLTTTKHEDGEIPLSSLANTNAQEQGLSGTCGRNDNSHYIQSFSSSATSMCDSGATSTVTCFTHEAWGERKDTFCMGTPAMLNPQSRVIYLDCPLRDITQEVLAGQTQWIPSLKENWYATGPGYIFDKYIDLKAGAGSITTAEGKNHIALLVKREGMNVLDNNWHALMQVMSLGLSIDVLRSTIDPSTGHYLYKDQDFANTQVIILDSEPKGHFYDLWDMYGGLPTVRLNESTPLALSKILVPLPGETNPVWQGKVELPPCTDSVLLGTFVKRTLEFLKIPPTVPKRSKLHITFIDRHTYRVLVGKEELLASLTNLLAKKYPRADIEVIDFADYTLREQLEKVRSTDILVGVHGAGLTHAMFLPTGSTVVEIQPPGLKFYGFETLARFLGHGYFQDYGYERDYEGKTGNWQADDVFMEEEKFLRLIETAITVREWREDYRERRLGFF